MINKNKNKVYLILIAILTITIFYTGYCLLHTKKEQLSIKDTNGKILGVKTENINISDINNLTEAKLPTKSLDYHKPLVYSDSYILIDADSNYILAEKNSSKQVPIASTTKIMTSVLSLENYSTDEIIEISKHAANQIGSEVYLKTGEKLTMDNVLHALLINSGNDAAMALAEHYKDGGLASFVKMMNDKAKLLGMSNTKYKDPAGLDDTGYSSAKDLSIITNYAMKFDKFRQIVKTVDYLAVSTDLKNTHTLKNSNRLIDPGQPLYLSYAIGIKTGYTPDAGHCMVSAATKNNTTLIAVILKTNLSTNDASAKESRKLLEWGFDNYSF